MSRKHNTKHPRRGRSRYPERLARRGVTNVDVRMTPLDQLRKAAARRGSDIRTLPNVDDYDDDLQEVAS